MQFKNIFYFPFLITFLHYDVFYIYINQLTSILKKKKICHNRKKKFGIVEYVKSLILFLIYYHLTGKI